MLDNATRRQLLNRHKASGFPGSIIDVYNAYNQGIDLISQFEMSNQPQMQVANTPQQQQEGLRPFHQQGQTNQSMVFPNVPPNTNFNTVGMKAPINIKKIDNQGNLVKSYENVPPGIQSLPTGPVGGTVIETPANMQSGGVRRYQAGNAMIDANGNPVSIALPPAGITTDSKDNSFWGKVKRHNQLEDGAFENIAEFFDPSGVSSWDDAYRARISWKESGRTFPTLTEVGDMLSALPAANIIKGGKFGLTTIQKLNNMYVRATNANDYINAAEDARQELIESKSNKKYGGVRKYQSGDVIRPENDPWEYKYENGKYLAKKKENKEWIVARGNALEAIKTKIYGLPSSRSNQPTPKQPPKPSAPSGPVVPMFMHPSFGSSQPPKQSPATQSSKPPIREVSRRKPIEEMDYTAVRDNTSIPTIGLRPERMQLPTYDEMGRPIALRQEIERRAQQTPAQLRPAPPNYAPSPESEEPGYLEQISSELSSGVTEATAWGRDMLSAFDRLQGKYGDADPEQLLNVPKDAIQIPQVESEAQPIKETYTELGTSPDRDGRQLSSFIHSFDNETGGTFRIGPKVLELYDMDTGKKRANAQTAIPGVAVAHFFRDSDISPNQKYTPKNWKIRSGYQFQNFADDKVLPYGERETSDPERYRMMYRQNEDGTYSVKYKRAKNIGESDEGWSYDLPVSGQHRFSDIDWDKEGPHTGWKNTSHYVPLKPGAQNIASLDMDRTGIPVRRGAPDEYSRFSGGSIVLLFTDPKTGREIGIDVAGSKNVLRDTGRKLIKEYGLREEDVTVVYHDMGSYSAKPRGKDGKLDYDQWFDFNTYNRGYSGAPLIIANQQSGGLRQNKSKYGKLLRSGGVRNKVPYYNKLKN